MQQAFSSPQRLTQVPQIRPLADIVHSKDSFTYLITYLQKLIAHRQRRCRLRFKSKEAFIAYTLS